MDDQTDEEKEKLAVAGSSWWSAWPDWLQVAREKSNTAYEFMKRDLTEFSHVVQTDVVAGVSSTAALLKEKLMLDDVQTVTNKARDTITTVLETIADAFVPQKEIEDTEVVMIQDSELVTLDRWQAQLYIIRKDPKTYCHEPEGPPELYENWLESFSLSDHEEEMTEMMLCCSEVRTLYDELVPSAVSHLEFWQRYFYRVHLLRKAELNEAELMRRTEQMLKSNSDSETKESQIVDNPKPASQKTDQSNDVCSEKPTYSVDSPFRKHNTFVNKENLTSVGCEKTLSVECQQVEVDKSKEVATDECEELNAVCKESKNCSPSATDENRLTPSDSASKGYSTGDEWEKDFDVELNESDLQQAEEILQNVNKSKESEEEWEKWE